MNSIFLIQQSVENEKAPREKGTIDGPYSHQKVRSHVQAHNGRTIRFKGFACRTAQFKEIRAKYPSNKNSLRRILGSFGLISTIVEFFIERVAVSRR